MSEPRRFLLVAVMSLGLLLLLLLLVAAGNFFAAEQPQTLVFRELAIATPPPPPPPPPNSNAAAATAPVDLSAANPQAPVLMLNLDLQVALPKGELLTSSSGGWGDASGNGLGLEIDWSGFSLAELDGYPLVLQAPVFKFPRSLVERGIKKVEARLHILIDETGRAYLMRVVETPDDRINAELEEFVKDVRFTPPTLAGVAVKAEFIWPVIFGSE